MGRVISGVCDCACACVCTVKTQFELSTQNVKIHGSRSACIDLESKYQGHMVIICSAGMGVHVDGTVKVF